MQLSAGKFWGLRRLADEDGRFKMVAVDQRPPLKDFVRSVRADGEASYEDVARIKSVIIEKLSVECSALLLDPYFAYSNSIQYVPPVCGLLLTLEDSEFIEESGGRLSRTIRDWNVAKIKRTGADAVKVLAWYHPDSDQAVRDHQHEFVAEVGRACARFDIPFLLELLVYPIETESQTVTRHRDAVLRSVTAFAEPRFGVDVFKLENPLGPGEVPDPNDRGAATRDAQRCFDELGRRAGRPWVVLSSGASPQNFHRVCEFAFRAGASGYLAGRTIWWRAVQEFPRWKEVSATLSSDSLAYMRALNDLTDSMALPWTDHPNFSGADPLLAGKGPEFIRHYADFGVGH